MKVSKLVTIGIFSLLATSLTYGESPRPAIDKADGVRENVMKCKKLINSFCGEKSHEECMKQQDPRSAQVSQCVNYMMANFSDWVVEDLNPKFADVYKGMTKKNTDINDCVKKAQVVCGDDSSFESCLISNPGAFPSYCRSAMKDQIDQMNAAYQHDPKLASCTDVLMAQCKLNFGDVDESQKETMKKIKKYQDCVEKAIPSTPACAKVIQASEGAAPAAASSVQLIGQ